MQGQAVIRAARNSRERDTMIRNAASVFKVSQGLFRDGVAHSPGHRLSHTRLAVVDGRIAGGVDVMHRILRIKGANIPMGGIADVHTLPDHRGKGLAGALLRDAAAYMISRGYLLSILFADLHDFYTKFGYECVPRTRWEIHSDAQFGKDPSVRVAQVNYLQSLDTLRDLYRRDVAAHRGLVLRTPSYWMGIPLMHRHRKPFSLVATMNGRAAGILVLEPETKKKRLRISECHAPGPHARALCSAMLQAAAAAARRRKWHTLTGLLPAQHPATLLLAEQGAARTTDNHLMAAILDPRTLAQRTGIATRAGNPLRSPARFMARAADKAQGLILWDDDKF